MRTPEFRGWDLVNRCLVDVWGISWKGWDQDDTTECVINEVTVYNWDGTYTLAEHQIVLMQYTGIKDKRGFKIFDGDITNEGVVCFSECIAYDSGGASHPGFYLKQWYDKEPEKYIELQYHTHLNSNLIVLGNIYTTPELIPRKPNE